MDLSTTYLGFELPHPLMPGASPLVDDLDTVRRLEDAGASAIVMHSLFEEQIAREQVATFIHTESHGQSFAEALTYFPSPDSFHLGPDEYLDHLRKIGVSQRTVQLERDLWILVQSISPKEAAILIDDKRKAIKDGEFRSIYLAYDAAFDWSPEDSRLHALADRAKRWLSKRPGRSKRSEIPVLDSTIVQLVATSFSGMSPAWDRLGELAKQR